MTKDIDAMRVRFGARQATEQQREEIERFWMRLADLANNLSDLRMDPRCRALALTKLEEAGLWIERGRLNVPWFS